MRSKRPLQPSIECFRLSAPRRSSLPGQEGRRGSVARGVAGDFPRCSCSREGVPPRVQSAELLDNYRFSLDAYAFSIAPPGEQIAVRAAFANSQKPQSTGGTNNWFVGAAAALCSFAEWQRQNLRRLEFRSQTESARRQFPILPVIHPLTAGFECY